MLRGRVIFFLAKLMLGLLGLGTTAMLTRWVGPTEYGAYAFGLSIILFTVGAGFGWLNLSLQRFRPGFREPEFLFGTLIVVFCALCCAIAAVAGLGIMLTNSWRYAPILAACLFAIFAAAWFELKQRVQLAELQAAPYFWTNVVRGTLILLLTFAAAYTQQSVTTMILATGVSTLIAASLFRTAHLDIFNWRFDREIGHMLFQFGLPVFVGFGVANVLISIDRWMLQLLSGSKAVGLFTAASFVAQVPIALLASGIGPSANALAVRAYEFTDGTTVKAQLEENLVSLLGIVLPAAVGITALSRNLAFVLVGENFPPAVIELAPWLCVASTLWAVRANYFDSALYAAADHDHVGDPRRQRRRRFLADPVAGRARRRDRQLHRSRGWVRRRRHRQPAGLQIAVPVQGDGKGRGRLGAHVFRPSDSGRFARRRRALCSAYDRLARLSHQYRSVGCAAVAPVAGPTGYGMAGSARLAVLGQSLSIR